MLDTHLKFYAVPSRPTWATLRSRSRNYNLNFWIKVFLKDFISWTPEWILFILTVMLDIGLKFYMYAVPSRPTWVTLRSRSLILKKKKRGSDELRCPMTALIIGTNCQRNTDCLCRHFTIKPEVIQLFSCSTQLSMKFVSPVNFTLLTIANSFLLNIAEHENFSVCKYENANYCWHFHIY